MHDRRIGEPAVEDFALTHSKGERVGQTRDRSRVSVLLLLAHPNRKQQAQVVAEVDQRQQRQNVEEQRNVMGARHGDLPSDCL